MNGNRASGDAVATLPSLAIENQQSIAEDPNASNASPLQRLANTVVWAFGKTVSCVQTMLSQPIATEANVSIKSVSSVIPACLPDGWGMTVIIIVISA